VFWNKRLKEVNVPTSSIDYEFYFSSSKHGDINLSVFEPGILNVTSGKIVVCDPLVCLGDSEPYNIKIESGKYPVKIVIASNEEIGERYAFAKLEIDKNKAIKWNLAITEALIKKVHELKNGEYFGFPVDAGLGSFCDFDTQILYSKYVNSFLANKPDANMYDDYFAALFKKNAKNQNDSNDIGDWLNYYVPDTENNVIMFHSGFGDGYYPAYWGYDENGKIVSLVIDFQVFGE
jgi:hypothetical protein